MILLIIHLLITAALTFFGSKSLGILNSDTLNIVYTAGMSLGIFILLLPIIFITCVLLSKLPSKNTFYSRYTRLLVRLTVSYACILFRIRIKTINKHNIPKDETYVIIGNHQAQVDIVALLQSFKKERISFVSKESIFKVPLVGTLMTRMGCVAMSRESDRKAAASLNKAIKNVKRGLNMTIFPEGTRSKGREMLEFKSGAFKLAMKPKVTILPITINDSFLVEKDVFKLFKKVKFSLTVHEPIRYEEYKELNSNELSDKVKAIISSAINK